MEVKIINWRYSFMEEMKDICDRKGIKERRVCYIKGEW